MEKHEWLVSLLDDLHSYASKNGLINIQEKLASVRAIAAVEIGQSRATPEVTGFWSEPRSTNTKALPTHLQDAANARQTRH